MFTAIVACMQGWWRIVADWCSRQWRAVRPGPEARRGAVWGALAAAFVCAGIGGLLLGTGFGYPFDFAFAFAVSVVVILVVTLVVALLLTLLRRLPRMASGMMAGCALMATLTWFPVPAGTLIAIAGCFLGATIATFVAGGFGESTLGKKIITVTLCALAVAANIYVVWLFAAEGSLEKLASWRPPAATMPAMLTAPNPAGNGPLAVKTLFYGAGTDIRRPEYGAGVAIKTRTVDASGFFEDFKGWRRSWRKRYWGFDSDRLPLNARVWYPEGPGPFPLVLIVHGNHDMADFSDPGYAYLGELLASRGFILASVDENYLNSGLFHDPPKQQQVRGWLLLEHLKLWREWNQQGGNPFAGKVDLNRIALMGHSRGGEAAATAAAFNRMKYYPEDANIRFNYGFAIQAVVAIAPADGQYKPAGQHRWIENVSYLTLQGAHDADVSSFMGSRQWDHVRYTQAGPWFKAEIYAYRANHGQFNTVWGRADAGEPLGWLLNLKPLMPGPEQRRISKTYIAAFLEAALHGRREYVPLFQDWRVARGWLPETLYLNRYQDASYVPLAGYQEDADLTTTTATGGSIEGENLSTWREGRIPFRRGDREYNGVFLGWNRGPESNRADAPVAAYSITLPANAASDWRLDAQSTVELSVAAMDEDAPLPGKKKDEKKKPDQKEREAPDFTIELVASDGAAVRATVSRLAAVPPPLKEKFTKVGVMEGMAYPKDWEPVFQTVRAPLAAFAGDAGAKPFDARKLSVVRLTFDRTPAGVICIGGVGFGRQ